MIIIVGMFFYDIPKFKQVNRRERIVYGLMMIPIIYLSLVYLMDSAWPTLDELVHSIFSKPAHQLVKSIQIIK